MIQVQFLVNHPSPQESSQSIVMSMCKQLCASFKEPWEQGKIANQKVYVEICSLNAAIDEDMERTSRINLLRTGLGPETVIGKALRQFPHGRKLIEKAATTLQVLEAQEKCAADGVKHIAEIAKFGNNFVAAVETTEELLTDPQVSATLDDILTQQLLIVEVLHGVVLDAFCEVWNSREGSDDRALHVHQHTQFVTKTKALIAAKHLMTVITKLDDTAMNFLHHMIDVMGVYRNCVFVQGLSSEEVLELPTKQATELVVGMARVPELKVLADVINRLKKVVHVHEPPEKEQVAATPEAPAAAAAAALVEDNDASSPKEEKVDGAAPAEKAKKEPLWTSILAFFENAGKHPHVMLCQKRALASAMEVAQVLGVIIRCNPLGVPIANSFKCQPHPFPIQLFFEWMTLGVLNES